MSSALSVDLRERVVRAVEAGAPGIRRPNASGSALPARAAGAGSLPVKVTSTPSLWVGISARTGSRPIRI